MSMADKTIVYPTGCLCGCMEGDGKCVRHKPIPSIKGCGGCLALSHEQIEYCSRQGYYCSPNSCARALLLGDAS